MHLRIENYKCFGEKGGGFERIAPVNVLIGRNNAGKSSLVELIRAITTYKAGSDYDLPGDGHKSKEPRIVIGTAVEEAVFSGFATRDGEYHQTDRNVWPRYKQFWSDNAIEWDLKEPQTSLRFRNGHSQIQNTAEVKQAFNILRQSLNQNRANPFNGKVFVHISSDRDVQPEQWEPNAELKPDGKGCTSIISYLEHADTSDPTLVTELLVDALNQVYGTDARFESINTRKAGTGAWEVFLHEEVKGRIRLSHSGSGLKTAILALVAMLLVPKALNLRLRNIVFVFEELENNLHPSIQKRLMRFVADLAVSEQSTLFLTTHSPVVIDLFADDEHCELVHVTQSDGVSTSNPVLTYTNKLDVLDELELRASDLLQANGVIWVEGPTDKLYLNRWISLWTDNVLREGEHYQCVFYGGSLLAHLSAKNPDLERSSVEILRVNRNAIVIADDDRESNRKRKRPVLHRFQKEMARLQSGALWITRGRHIEHYIPLSVIRALFRPDARDVNRFEHYRDYLNSIKPKAGDSFNNNKLRLAKSVLPLLTKEELGTRMDLSKRMASTCAAIASWNGIDLQDT